MVCAWSNFRKKSYGIFIYDKWNFKLQILSIVHFDRVIAGQMAHISGVKWTIFETIHKKMSERLMFLIFLNAIQFHGKCNSWSQSTLELSRLVCNSTGGYSLLVTNELFQDWKVLVKSPREILPLSSSSTMWENDF